MSESANEVSIKYSGNTYAAEKYKTGIRLRVNFPSTWHQWLAPDEESARRWLCDHSLRKSKAKKLLAAALRGEGEFADSNHKCRVR